MRLKSFTTYGFKSFAEKTELHFDQGITAVVGPNGSGKSNISDAVRWVLGEQSARYLRGTKMEDVIFAGTSKRKALGVAEVSLTFDNSRQELPLDFAEVTLTRRLYRSGESDYFINRKPCRLKDILDLLADTGLGKGSMAIIGQNKIDEILNGRPEDRRALFEEAAGIAKYRLRKKEAVRRLEDTANNLLRIKDIRSEVEKQLAPLAAAAKKTEAYKSLQASLQSCRLSSLLRQLEAMAKAQEALLKEKQGLDAGFSKATAALGAQEAVVGQIQLELEQVLEAYGKLQDLIRQDETALERHRGQGKVLEERISQSRQAQSRLASANERLEERATNLEAKLTALSQELDQLEAAASKGQKQLTALGQARAKAQGRLEQAKAEQNAQQSSMVSQLQALVELKGSLGALEQAQEQRAKARQQLKQDLEALEQQLQAVKEQQARLLEEQAQGRLQFDQLDCEKKALEVHGSQLEQELKAITQGQSACQQQYTEAEARLEALTKLQQAYEGFGQGSKAVLRARAPWRGGIIGVVAELLQVEPQYVAAIETALGDGAQNLVAQDAATAKAAIAYLKEQRAGRATFLPLDTVKGRHLNEEERALTKLEGICGYGDQLIGFEEYLAPAMSSLLGKILIAENMDYALAAAKAGKYKIKVVTLEGDVVNTGGSLTGGSRQHREGYLSRRQELNRLSQRLADLSAVLLDWQEQLEAKEEQQKANKKALQEKQELLQALLTKGNGLYVELSKIEGNIKSLDRSLINLSQERSQVTEEYLTSRDQVKELREQVAALSTKDSAVKEQLALLDNTIASHATAVQALDNQLQDAKIKVESLNAKSSYLQETIKNIDDDIVEVAKEQEQNNDEQEALEEIIKACTKDLEALEVTGKELLQKLQKKVSGKDEFITNRSNLQAKASEEEAKLTQLKAHQQQWSERRRQQELELVRQQEALRGLEEQLGQEFSLSPQEAGAQEAAAYKELALEQLQKQETKLALDLANLGPVNHSAPEEYAALVERCSFMAKQYEDLEAAKNNLEQVISQINSGMTKRFKEALGKINEYFAQTYGKLFGGGQASLKLTEPEDYLNSGIEIQVQPPGKKLQSLYLLSGGERALTVIALLFALLTYKPAPFCVLDEIDAALDDANILRFAEFLKDYGTDTQFIVITHRKGTMEVAHVLYGVTMEESGVSKLLSVKINGKE